MTSNLIQTGTHNGKQVTAFDLSVGLETVGEIRITIDSKHADKLKGLEKLIQKHLEKP